MNLGIAFVVVAVVVFLILKCIVKFSLKIIGLGILILAVSLTIWVCSVKPEIHKQFSLNTIEYLIKINKDGSVTKTKQVTQTIYNEKGAN